MTLMEHAALMNGSCCGYDTPSDNEWRIIMDLIDKKVADDRDARFMKTYLDKYNAGMQELQDAAEIAWAEQVEAGWLQNQQRRQGYNQKRSQSRKKWRAKNPNYKSKAAKAMKPRKVEIDLLPHFDDPLVIQPSGSSAQHAALPPPQRQAREYNDDVDMKYIPLDDDDEEEEDRDREPEPMDEGDEEYARGVKRRQREEEDDDPLRESLPQVRFRVGGERGMKRDRPDRAFERLDPDEPGIEPLSFEQEERLRDRKRDRRGDLY